MFVYAESIPSCAAALTGAFIGGVMGSAETAALAMLIGEPLSIHVLRFGYIVGTPIGLIGGITGAAVDASK